MDIRKLSIRLMVGWSAIYIVAGLIALLFYTNVFTTGCVTDAKTIYLMQIIGVMTALAMIPVALGGFKRLMVRVAEKPYEDRLRIYTVCSWIRLAAFFIVVGYGVALYFLINDSIGLYCAVIGAICSMFCFPTRNTIEYEVNRND